MTSLYLKMRNPVLDPWLVLMVLNHGSRGSSAEVFVEGEFCSPII